MRGFVIGVAATAIGFVALTYVMPRVAFHGDPLQLIVLSLVFGVVNGFIKPVVRLLLFPLTFMTLGLFGPAINGGPAPAHRLGRLISSTRSSSRSPAFPTSRCRSR